MAHTPGPWHYSADYTAESGEPLFAIRKREAFIASGAMEDDARIIAAAPDLLAALREVYENSSSDSPDMWRRVNAAIAKATIPQRYPGMVEMGNEVYTSPIKPRK